MWRTVLAWISLGLSAIWLVLTIVLVVYAFSSEGGQTPLPYRILGYVVVGLIICSAPLISLLAAVFAAPIVRPRNTSGDTPSVFE
jgi:hypothetical protein